MDDNRGHFRAWGSFRPMFMVLALALPFVVESAVLPPWLEEDRISDQIVTVRVFKDDRLAAEGAGVVVGNEGNILTSAAVLDAGPRVTVITIGAGELAAVVLLKEKDSGLGILRAEGLSSDGLPLSVEAPVSGNRIFSVLQGATDEGASIVAGAIGEAEVRAVREENIRLYRHNAMITSRWYGSPAIDECGRIIAVNIPEPGTFSLFTVPRKVEPKDVVFALGADYMASRLESLDVEVVQETGRCISADMRAQQRAQEAEQAQERVRQAEEEARRAGEEVQQALQQAQESQSQSENAQEEARRSKEAAERAQGEAEQARQDALRAGESARRAELEAEQADAQLAEAMERMSEGRRTSEKQRRLMVWGGSAGGLLLLVILLSWLISEKRKRRKISLAQAMAAGAEREAAAALERVDKMLTPAPFDCMLVGEDKTGSPLALSLRREILGDPAGAVIGRNPAGSVYIVADPSVSREHARIYVEDGIPYVEDMNSTNGTSLNGHSLSPGVRSQIGDGDQLTLGSVSFRVKIQ